MKGIKHYYKGESAMTVKSLRDITSLRCSMLLKNSGLIVNSAPGEKTDSIQASKN